MRFSTTNLTVSMTNALATYLRSQGYDIRWHVTDTIDAQTAGLPAPRATITLVPEFPANPAGIVRLKTEEMGPDVVAVPALSLQVVGAPARIAIRGLGHTDYEWARRIRVDGLAADEFQHREFQDLLHRWLMDEEWKTFPIYDHELDPADPEEIGPVYVTRAAVNREELYLEVEAARYYVRAQASLSYIE